jgi:hypothetical protein
LCLYDAGENPVFAHAILSNAHNEHSIRQRLLKLPLLASQDPLPDGIIWFETDLGNSKENDSKKS